MYIFKITTLKDYPYVTDMYLWWLEEQRYVYKAVWMYLWVMGRGRCQYCNHETCISDQVSVRSHLPLWGLAGWCVRENSHHNCAWWTAILILERLWWGWNIMKKHPLFIINHLHTKSCGHCKYYSCITFCFLHLEIKWNGDSKFHF